MRELINKYGTQAGAALMVVMVLLSFGIPVPSLQGGDLHVEQRQAVGESDALAPLVAVGVYLAAGAATGAVYDAYIDERNASAMTDSELKVAIAQDAYAAKQTQENYITDSQNALELARNDARQEAYQEYVTARMNGSSHSEAVTQAKNRVDDFYSKHELQLLRKYETQVVRGGGYCQMAEQWQELGNNNAVAFGSNPDFPEAYQVDCAYHQKTNEYFTGTTTTSTGKVTGINDSGKLALDVKLINGTNVTVRTAGGTSGDGTSGNTQYWINPYAESQHTVLKVNDPNATADVSIPITDSSSASYKYDYGDMFADIQTQNTNVQDTLGNSSSGFLADVDAYYETNNVTWSELAVDEPDLDNLSSEEYYRVKLGQYHDGPPQGTVVTIETGDGSGNLTTYNGSLYTTWAPPTDPDNDSDAEWKTGYTYNASQGSTYIVTESGELRHVTGDMTLTAIETPDGTSVNVTEHKDVTLDTSDTSDLKNATDRLNERIDEIEASQSSGGGFTIPDIFGQSGMGVILIAGVAFILLSQRGGGGSTTIIRGRKD